VKKSRRPVRRQGAYTVTAAEVHGPWVDRGWQSGLIDRVRPHWSVPFSELADVTLALFLRQRIAVDPLLTEARRRLASGRPAGTELYDVELAAAVGEAGSA
jgi:hypothetical protein